MRYAKRRHAGFTLIEVLLVITLVGILAALVVPSAEPSLNDQLRATARILATDLAYARSLAVTNNSQYRLTFDVKENCYSLSHSGSNAGLDLLPESPFSRSAGPQPEMIVDLDELPQLGARVRLAAVAEYNWSVRSTAKVEFGPLGETTSGSWTIIWLQAGNGGQARYVLLLVHPITGLVEVSASTESGPPNWLAASP
jgi:prepilin-type N-terminal cleavage/methylation domain-containing protein